LLDLGVNDTGVGTKNVEATLNGDPIDDGDALTVGIYNLVITARDYALNESSLTVENVVVYDPSAGFVTGGGWFYSDPGNYIWDLSAEGKATFGFVSKYKKNGADEPDGQTEFQFKAGDLNFHSTSYQWLVVAGAHAKFKGNGTINGDGNYEFMLTATDSQINGGGDVDSFRIKIWCGYLLIYDNKMG
jgi:hypothetical protein